MQMELCLSVELSIIWFSIKILIYNSESFSKRAILSCEIPYVFFWCNWRNQSVSKLHFFRERVPGHFKIPHTTWAPLRKRDPKLSELWNFFSIKTFHASSFAKRYLSRVHWYKVHGWLISPTKEDFCEKKDSERVPKKRQRRRHGTVNWFNRSTLSTKNQDTIEMKFIQ